MKTNRPVMFLVIFLCSWLGIVAPVWPEEQKSIAPGRQITSPTVGGPAKAQPATTLKAIKNLVPQVVVFSPAEGETWYGGETRDIQWKTLAIPGGSKIKIEFIRSDATKLPLGDNLPSSGKFSWKITEQAFLTKQVANPYGGMPSYIHQNTQGKLKLTASYEGKTSEGERSISLVIPGLKITSPKQGDVWYAGKTYAVAWQNIGSPLSTVDIWLGTSGGFSFPLYTTHMANTGSASITVPASPLLEDTTNFKLSVQSSATYFPENYIHDKVQIKIMK